MIRPYRECITIVNGSEGGEEGKALEEHIAKGGEEGKALEEDVTIVEGKALEKHITIIVIGSESDEEGKALEEHAMGGEEGKALEEDVTIVEGKALEKHITITVIGSESDAEGKALEDHDSNCRRLTLSNTRFSSLPSPPPPPPPLPPQSQHLSSPPLAQQPPLILPRFTSGPSAAAPAAVNAPVHQLRARRNRSQGPRRADKSNTVVPPFPWATDRRATVHSLVDLRSLNITEINGEVQCRRCDVRKVIGYDLATKFSEVAEFVARTKEDMHDRAPDAWMNPPSDNCQYCGQPGTVRPVIAAKKRSINWLFLLLGQNLGLCTLDQLKYFCKHTQNHRTGAKDRVLYLTYLNLCKQLDPTGPFDR